MKLHNCGICGKSDKGKSKCPNGHKTRLDLKTTTRHIYTRVPLTKEVMKK